jgi:N-formylglutamate deformylase
MSAPLFDLTSRDGPLIISAPHPGQVIPEPIARELTPDALAQPDADHVVHQLYDFAAELGATTLTATHSRYVVDLNRAPDDQPLYPGQFGSGLVPTDSFDGAALYQTGREPDAAARAQRVEGYWRPYHDELARLIRQTRDRHGYCLLWDAHSIAAEAPRLFEGRLPDLNLGSFDGRACPTALAQEVLDSVPADAPYSRVLDGRFKGGFITRHYGAPADCVFALQLELSQDIYLGGDHRHLSPSKHAALRPVLRAMLETFLSKAHDHV